MGANTAVFTLIQQLILQPLPVKAPEQLVMLAGRGDHYGGSNGPDRMSYAMFQDIRDRNELFSGMFCAYSDTVSLTVEGKTELITAEMVSGSYFPILGISAVIGRVFSASDNVIQGGQPVAVLSHGYWKNRFSADRSVLGKKIIVNGFPFTIIGVSQAGFGGIQPGYSPQIRIPITMHNDLARTTLPRLNNRRFRWVTVFGRLKPGMTLKSAQAGLQPLFHQILDMEVQQQAFAKASPFVKQEFQRMWLEVIPGSKGRSELRDRFEKPLVALMAMVTLVLLIACSNLANLLIARASARQKEIAVRLALGASRWSLIRQLLVESLLMSTTGGVLGLWLAILMDRALIDFLPSDTTAVSLSTSPDWTVLGFAALISCLAGAVFGLVPALSSTRLHLANTLQDQASAVVQGGPAGLRKILVVGQVVFSLMLLICAGLFLQSLRKLQNVNPGFDVRDLLSFAVEPTLGHSDPGWTLEYYRRLMNRLKTVRGVESVALAVIPLLQGYEWDNWVTVEGYTPSHDEGPETHMQYCSPGFFAALRIPLLLGRDFTTKDAQGAPKVGIVNQKFVTRYFGAASPIGRHLGMGIDPGTKMDIEIIGVVGDTKYENMRREVPYVLYVPYLQQAWAEGMTAYVRARGDPAGLFRMLRNVVHDVDPDVPMYGLRTLHDQIDVSLMNERLLAELSGAFGVLATLLAALGLYGVTAFMVARRTREIGLRIALGASGASVIWMVTREVLALAAVGVAIGLASAWAAMRLLEAQLFGIKPTDPLTMAMAALGVGTVAALSGYRPARRASSIDPVRALRWE
jgi:predicted permease